MIQLSCSQVGKLHKLLIFLRNVLRYTASYYAGYFHLAQLSCNRSFKFPLLLKRVNLEITSVCNLKCKYCPIGNGQRASTGHMEMEVFKKSLYDIVECARNGIYFSELHLFSGGEPFTHPNLGEMMGLLSKVRAETPNFPRTAIYTNCTLLTERKTGEVLSSGAIDEINFSIDMGSKRGFEEIRKGACFDSVVSNAVNAVRMIKSSKLDVKVRLVCLIHKVKNTEISFEPNFMKLKDVVDEFEIRFFHNWTGDINLGFAPDEYRRAKKTGGICAFITDNQVILSDGNITHCCTDISARGVYGNIMRVSLGESVLSPVKRRMIKSMSKNRRGDIHLCQACEL